MRFVVRTVNKESGLYFCQHMRTIKDWTTANIRESARKRTGDSVGKDWRSFLQPAVFVIPVKGAGGDAGGVRSIQAFSPGCTAKFD
jgi:hypothetical protein